MNTRLHGRQNQQNRPYNPYIHRGRGRGKRNYPSYDRGRGNFRQRLMIEILKDTLLSEAYP